MSTEALPEEKKEAILKFRERIQDILVPEIDDDNYLSRWIVARNFNLDKAEEMLRKHIRFVRLNGLDKLEDYVPCKATDYVCTNVLGYDKDGSLVRIIHLGASDLKGLTLSISKLDSIKFAACILQQDAKRQKKERENEPICTKQVYVFDMENLNWRSIIYRTVVERSIALLKTYENNYPECLKVVYVVNAPSFFNFVFNWLKTILPESIISKLKIISREAMKNEAKEHIDLSILPASVGGTMVDKNGDPNCASMYKMPLNSMVPEDLLLYNQFNVLENDPLSKKATVDVGCVLKVSTIITEPFSVLQWDFQTLQYDVGVGLNYKENEKSESKVIFPLHRVDSHLCTETGTFQCPEEGIYELVFDNTFSWFTSKELTYKVAVQPPDRKHES